MKYLFILVPILVISACQTLEPELTCRQGRLQSCTPMPFYQFWENPACETIMDAESGEAIICEE